MTIAGRSGRAAQVTTYTTISQSTSFSGWT